MHNIDINHNHLPSPSIAFTAFWSFRTSSKIYLSLQVFQTLQHCSIQLMLLFLGFNQASHGGCNISRFVLESPSIRIYVIISITDIFSHGIFCSLLGILSIIPIMGSHDWTATYLPKCTTWNTALEGNYDSANVLITQMLDAYCYP